MSVEFFKMTGTGNDFIVVDNRTDAVGEDRAAFAARWCARRTGVGADGVLLIEPAEGDADFRMRIFNADGSEPEMCGNGARCAARFACVRGIAPHRMIMQTLAGPVSAEVGEQKVTIGMGRVGLPEEPVRLDAEGRQWEVHAVESGVPHAIIFTDDLEGAPVEAVGRAIRRHRYFQPRGTNVDFVRVDGKQSISIRTYERGVEAETLACGTGAIGSAVVAHATGRVSSPPVDVRVPGGTLTIDFRPGADCVTDARLTGDAVFVYEARLL